MAVVAVAIDPHIQANAGRRHVECSTDQTRHGVHQARKRREVFGKSRERGELGEPSLPIVLALLHMEVLHGVPFGARRFNAMEMLADVDVCGGGGGGGGGLHREGRGKVPATYAAPLMRRLQHTSRGGSWGKG